MKNQKFLFSSSSFCLNVCILKFYFLFYFFIKVLFAVSQFFSHGVFNACWILWRVKLEEKGWARQDCKWVSEKRWQKRFLAVLGDKVKSRKDVSGRRHQNTPINETERNQMSGSALRNDNLFGSKSSGKCVSLIGDRKILQGIKGKAKFLLSGRKLWLGIKVFGFAKLQRFQTIQCIFLVLKTCRRFSRILDKGNDIWMLIQRVGSKVIDIEMTENNIRDN